MNALLGEKEQGMIVTFVRELSDGEEMVVEEDRQASTNLAEDPRERGIEARRLALNGPDDERPAYRLS